MCWNQEFKENEVVPIEWGLSLGPTMDSSVRVSPFSLSPTPNETLATDVLPSILKSDVPHLWTIFQTLLTYFEEGEVEEVVWKPKSLEGSEKK